MAIAFHYLESMTDMGLLPTGSRVLDVGCSNLYEASADGVSIFLGRFGVSDDDFAARIAKASREKSAFAGELITRCGIHYDAIDIAADFNTTVFDLNHDRLPRQFRKSFDLVLNFGTTEHVLNQAHAFKVIHEATKPGGHVVHQVPVGGFTNHGYFVYTGRFFFDLAGYNQYEVVDCRLEQAGKSSLSAPLKDYASYFPVLAEADTRSIDKIADSWVTVIYRKAQDKPFVFPMETSTSYSMPSARRRFSLHRLRRFVASRIA